MRDRGGQRERGREDTDTSTMQSTQLTQLLHFVVNLPRDSSHNGINGQDLQEACHGQPATARQESVHRTVNS